VFHIDIAKLDQDVAYVAKALHICCKHLVPNVSSIFSDVCCKCVYLDVAYVSHICCKCFFSMLHIFAMVFKCFRCFFVSVSDACVKCYAKPAAPGGIGNQGSAMRLRRWVDEAAEAGVKPGHF